MQGSGLDSSVMPRSDTNIGLLASGEFEKVYRAQDLNPLSHL